MTDALTATPWLAVLDRIKRASDDDTTRTLAQMLYDILKNTNDPAVGFIFDIYASQLLERTS